MAPDAATAAFLTQRPRLLRLAYRMLGSSAAAEDAVQEAWLRWCRVGGQQVRDPPAFLLRIVARLCLDELRSARARREVSSGTWLPEPLVEPDDGALDADDLTHSLMMALERLSPLERAAFLLHDVFGQPLDEVAGTLGRAPSAVRQLAARARRHVEAARPRYPVGKEEGERIARAFFSATQTGDLDALRSMLAHDVVIRSDGGGKVLAFRNPIAGAERVLRLYGGLFRKLGPNRSNLLQVLRVDGLPAYLSLEPGGIAQTTSFEIDGGRIVGIYITRDPDKLGNVIPLATEPGVASQTR